jgi:hypothetical protein
LARLILALEDLLTGPANIILVAHGGAAVEKNLLPMNGLGVIRMRRRGMRMSIRLASLLFRLRN